MSTCTRLLLILGILLVVIVAFIMAGKQEEALTLKNNRYIDIDKESIKILDGSTFVFENNTIIDGNYICPKCGSTELLFKPSPITIKREVGATAEVTGKWFCNKCGHSVE